MMYAGCNVDGDGARGADPASQYQPGSLDARVEPQKGGQLAQARCDAGALPDSINLDIPGASGPSALNRLLSSAGGLNRGGMVRDAESRWSSDR